MGFLARIKAWRKNRGTKSLDRWFLVSFDDLTVNIRAEPPGKARWTQSFPWSSVTRVCFKDEGPWASDGIYVFTSLRPESFVIPTEASGGSEFFGALVGRGLFPEELMSKAVTATDGGIYCWPPMEREDETGRCSQVFQIGSLTHDSGFSIRALSLRTQQG
jgi:hypothetical protein